MLTRAPLRGGGRNFGCAEGINIDQKLLSSVLSSDITTGDARDLSERTESSATGRAAGRRKQYAAAAAATIRRPGNRTSEIDGGYRSDHGVWPDLWAARHPTGRQPAPRGAAAVSAAAAAAAARTGELIPAGCRPRDHIQPPPTPPPSGSLSPPGFLLHSAAHDDSCCTGHDAKFHPFARARYRYVFRLSLPPACRAQRFQGRPQTLFTNVTISCPQISLPGDFTPPALYNTTARPQPFRQTLPDIQQRNLKHRFHSPDDSRREPVRHASTRTRAEGQLFGDDGYSRLRGSG